MLVGLLKAQQLLRECYAIAGGEGETGHGVQQYTLGIGDVVAVNNINLALVAVGTPQVFGSSHVVDKMLQTLSISGRSIVDENEVKLQAVYLEILECTKHLLGIARTINAVDFDQQYCQVATDAEAPEHGRGISPNAIAAALGIESTKDIVFILAENESKSSIYNAILDATKKERAHLGCMFTSPAGQLIKNGTVTGEEMLMPENNSQDLITVILNSGYADDAMDAARRAGAGGGTVIKARGTARPDDPQFFGMHIVPEKETLLIVVPHEKKDAVLDAIKNLECLSQPGSGIAYCSPVNEFVLLGKK